LLSPAGTRTEVGFLQKTLTRGPDEIFRHEGLEGVEAAVTQGGTLAGRRSFALTQKMQSSQGWREREHKVNSMQEGVKRRWIIFHILHQAGGHS
jgi:hypothetical protein